MHNTLCVIPLCVEGRSRTLRVAFAVECESCERLFFLFKCVSRLRLCRGRFAHVNVVGVLVFEKRRKRKRLHAWKCMLGKVKAEKSVVGVCCWLFGFNYQQYYCLCRIVTCFRAHYCMYQSSIIVWVGDQAQYCISTQYYCLHWQLGTISCRAAQYYSSLHVTLLAILFTALENTPRKPLFKFGLCICSAVCWHDFVSSCKLFLFCYSSVGIFFIFHAFPFVALFIFSL